MEFIDKNSFLNSDSVFDNETPGYLLCDEECAKASIDRDIDSARFIKNIPLELIDYTISKALKESYILNYKSPLILRRNCAVALQSIKLDVNSVDFVDRELKALKPEEIEKIIEAVADGEYVLSNFSPYFLCINAKVVLGSIKKDINSYHFAKREVLSNPEVFNYLITHGVKLDDDVLDNVNLNQVMDKDVLSRCFEQLEVYGYTGGLYKERFDSLFSEALNKYPTIESFKSIFQANAERMWESFKKSNFNALENIFGKISAELRNCNNFKTAIASLIFIRDMISTLGNQYDDLYNAMKEYFDIYHSDVDDKIEKMQPAQDKISYYAALYCGKRKDDFIRKEIGEYNYWLKQFFVLKLDNPTVNKKLVQRKKKEKFKELYQEGNEEIVNFIDGIIKKYSEVLDSDVVSELVFGFVESNKAKIEEIIPKPDNYDAYERYEKADKLIKRLNLGYISFSGPEVKSYKDVIGFDEEKGEYIYTGVSFSDDNRKHFERYKNLGVIFEEIKREISSKIRNMNIEVEVSLDDEIKLEEELPFIDEYFEFNKVFLSYIKLANLRSAIIPYYCGFESYNFENDDSYELIKDILIKYGILWLMLFRQISCKDVFGSNWLNCDEVEQMIDSTYQISQLAKGLNIDISSFKKILLMLKICGSAEKRSIAILGLDIVEKLCKNIDFTDGNTSYIVSTAERLVAMMAIRSMSTVPYVSGETMNYKYSLYDSQDVDVLLAGINTDACFRVCGNDNDFLHYCCLDKNGFVIKITDKDGNFIGRAGGFRNGNCVFLNQLRTIYDERNDNYQGLYKNETMEIIETLRKACEEIVRTSQENELESEKIDHVFVTRSYSLKYLKSNVSKDVDNYIDEYPMDMDSRDWEDFVDENDESLGECSYIEGFNTDYREYSLICLTSTKEIADLEPNDLRFGDVDALYERTRNKIIATTNIDDNIMRKIKKIKGITSYFNYKEYEEVMIPEGSTVFVGDNWYLVYHEGKIVSSCVLEFDEKAKREFSLASETYEDVIKKINQQRETGLESDTYYLSCEGHSHGSKSN